MPSLASVVDVRREGAHQRGDRRTEAGGEAVDGCVSLSEDLSRLAFIITTYSVALPKKQSLKCQDKSLMDLMPQIYPSLA